MPLPDRSRTVRARAESRLARIVHPWRPVGMGRDEFGDEEFGASEQGRPRVILGPWSRPALRGLVLLVLLLVGVVGYLTWQSRPRDATPVPELLQSGVPFADADPGAVEDAPAVALTATPAVEVVVHVSGAVRRPGLVHLAPGSRVADALAAAGGVTAKGTAESVNLARIVVDGEQIVVTDTAAAPGAPATASAGAPAVVDLNAATLEQLDALPGVGPVLAGRILAWRTSNGRFSSVAELGEVSGIGEAILAQLRPLVRV